MHFIFSNTTHLKDKKINNMCHFHFSSSLFLCPCYWQLNVRPKLIFGVFTHRRQVVHCFAKYLCSVEIDCHCIE